MRGLEEFSEPEPLSVSAGEAVGTLDVAARFWLLSEAARTLAFRAMAGNVEAAVNTKSAQRFL